MPKTKMQELSKFGQSIWLDNINRSLIESGKLKELIDNGLRGLTSNPAIFDKAISKSNEYDLKIAELSNAGKTTFEIYDDLTISDIQEAADLFKPVYEKTGGVDGYVSLEIDPRLAFKVDETVKEGLRLYQKVHRSNLMLKIPATGAGFKAAEELIARGLNVNFTLIFSLQQYVNTAKTYINGLKRLSKSIKNLSRVNSVASVFVSRIDNVVDKIIEENKNKNLLSLKGKAAAANSSIIFQEYQDIFSSEDFKNLKNKGARLQRVLWASTGTKNPAYSDIKYITELIGKNTVNTVPDNTLEAFLDHGVIKEALTANAQDAKNVIDNLAKFGIDINQVCKNLLSDGLSVFESSFNSLLSAIENKAGSLCMQGKP